MPNKQMNNSMSTSKESLSKKLGDKIERIGEKVSRVGARKIGRAIYNAGNKIEHSK
jgi:hypothetical protein